MYTFTVAELDLTFLRVVNHYAKLFLNVNAMYGEWHLLPILLIQLLGNVLEKMLPDM
jgi:hypothetical protein